MYCSQERIDSRNMYVYIHIDKYTYVCAHIYTCAYMNSCVRIYICVRILHDTYICILRAYMCVCARARVQYTQLHGSYMHMHITIYRNAYVYTGERILLSEYIYA